VGRTAQIQILMVRKFFNISLLLLALCIVIGHNIVPHHHTLTNGEQRHHHAGHYHEHHSEEEGEHDREADSWEISHLFSEVAHGSFWFEHRGPKDGVKSFHYKLPIIIGNVFGLNHFLYWVSDCQFPGRLWRFSQSRYSCRYLRINRLRGPPNFII